VVDPRTIICLRFLGGAISLNLVSDGGTGDVFCSAVRLNQSFYAQGDFRGEFAIEISAVDGEKMAAAGQGNVASFQ
jgi:hypothetical protein